MEIGPLLVLACIHLCLRSIAATCDALCATPCSGCLLVSNLLTKLTN